MLFKKAMGIGVLGLLLGLMMAGCSVGSPDIDVAQKAVDGFYQAEQQQDIKKALTYFTSQRPAEDWRSHLEHVRDVLGTVKSYTLKHTEVNTVLSGRFYIFDYQVKYSSGKTAGETLTLFDSVSADDTPLITAHVITAEGYTPLF